jgi:DNA topoisomerase-3
VEDKETRPPPRYNEGTLIEAMQNAWRFVADEALQARLKEAKGIGTPATRAEIIRGLKAQDFLAATGKHIAPTERGLALFGVLQRADPALVDPGVTAQMERPLDDVLVRQQEMVGAIDAACAQASRIIGRLLEGTTSADAALLSAAIPASVGDNAGRRAPPRTGRQRSRASGHDHPSAPPRRSDAPQDERRRKRGRKGKAGRTPAKRSNKAVDVAVSGVAAASETPLRIPFGNKETALALGARYRAGGWYAPPGVDLSAFRARGWL